MSLLLDSIAMHKPKGFGQSALNPHNHRAKSRTSIEFYNYLLVTIDVGLNKQMKDY